LATPFTSLGFVSSVRSSHTSAPSTVTMWSPRLSRSRPLDIAVFPLPPNLEASSAVTPVAVVVDRDGSVVTVTSFGDHAIVRPPKGPQACVAVGAFWRRNIVFVGLSSGTLEVFAWHSGAMRWLPVGTVPPPATPASSTSGPQVSWTWSLLDIVEEVLLHSGHVRFVVCGVLQAASGPGTAAPGMAHVSLTNVTVGHIGELGPSAVSLATQPVFSYDVDWPSQSGSRVVAASVVKLPSTVSDLLRSGDVFQGAASTVATPVTPSTTTAAAGGCPSTVRACVCLLCPPSAELMCVAQGTLGTSVARSQSAPVGGVLRARVFFDTLAICIAWCPLGVQVVAPLASPLRTPLPWRTRPPLRATWLLCWPRAECWGSW
jgi:hypothetical protein